jgi:hypothetical protein
MILRDHLTRLQLLPSSRLTPVGSSPVALQPGAGPGGFKYG